MIQVRHIETHVTHSCNFTCESCSHFSNDGHSGRETPESFRERIGPWAARLKPDWFLILGGEPLMNPQILEIVPIARKLWPDPSVRIALVTNGWLLHKFGKKLPEVLVENDIFLDVSIHHDDERYLAKLMNELISACNNREGVKLHIRSSHDHWTRIYKGSGGDVLPYEDGNQRKAWDACASRWCMNIREGKLWKCPPLTYLPMQKQKFPDISDKWDPYLQYEPLEPTCTEEELAEFVDREDESFCKMCPISPEKLLKSLPVKL